MPERGQAFALAALAQVALALAMLVGSPPTARADGRLTLRWEPAPEVPDCPSSAEVLAAVHAALGVAPSRADGVRVEARVRPAPGGVHLDLVADVAGQPGRRELQGPTCRAVVEAMSLIVAMLLDASELGRPGVLENPYAPPNPYDLSQLTSYDSGWHARDPGTRPPPHLRLGVAMGVAAGALPGPSAELAVSGELCGGAFCGRVDVGALLPRSAAVQSPSGASMRLGLGRARLGGDYRVRRRDWELGPALALELGVMVAASHGVADPGRGRAPWVAAAAGAFARRAWGRLWLGLEGAVTVPFARPSFVIGGVGDVFRTAPVSGGVRLTLGWGLR